MTEPWKRAESRVAEHFGGRVQPGSGCMEGLGLKHDVVTPEHLIEVKFSRRGKYRVPIDVIDALRARAAKVGKSPLLVCVFGKGQSWKAFYAYACDILRENAGKKSILVDEKECRWSLLWL